MLLGFKVVCKMSTANCPVSVPEVPAVVLKMA